MNLKISETKDWLPIIGSFLLFLSIIRHTLFYLVYGIQLTNYLDFSESVLLYLTDIVITIIILSLTICILYFLPSIVSLVFGASSNQSLRIYLFGIVCLISALTAIQIGGILYYFNVGILDVFAIPVIIASVLVPVSVQVTKRFLENLPASKIFPVITKSRFIIFVVSLVCLLIQTLYLLYDFDKINKADSKIDYTLTNKTHITTSKDTISLGRTSSYIFLYLPKRQTSIVMKSDSVEMIETKSNSINILF